MRFGDSVFLIHSSNIVTPLAALISFVWGWITTGGLLRIAIRLAEMVAAYYIQESDWYAWTKHFIENHTGLRPSQCLEGQCRELN